MDIPATIESTYEDTKTKEQNFIMNVNEINVQIEQLEADVTVAEIDASSVRESAVIEADIITKDGDVQKLVTDSKVMYDAQMIIQAFTSLNLGTVQAAQTFTQGDQILGYWFTRNYCEDDGYKNLVSS